MGTMTGRILRMMFMVVLLTIQALLLAVCAVSGAWGWVAVHAVVIVLGVFALRGLYRQLLLMEACICVKLTELGKMCVRLTEEKEAKK